MNFVSHLPNTVIYPCRQALKQVLQEQTSFFSDYRDVSKNFDKMSELTGLNIKDLKKEGDKYSLIQYFLDGPTYNDKWLKEKGVHSIESAYSLQRLVKHIGRHANIVLEDLAPDGDYVKLAEADILQEIGPTPTFPDLFPEIVKGEYITQFILYFTNEFL